MNPLSDQRAGPDHEPPRAARVVQVSVQPKTWFGKLVAAIVGVAVMLLALFLSVLVFAVLASLAVVAVLYIAWAARRARRAAQSQIIDNEAQNPGPL